MISDFPPQYVLTHYYRRSPNPQGWIQTAFITRFEGQSTYFLTFSDQPVSPKKIDNDVDNGSLVELPIECKIGTDQAVWIAPDQTVYLSDARKPRSSNPRQINQDNILSPYDAIDLAVRANFDEYTSSLERYFSPDSWKLLLTIAIKYIRNEQIDEDRFANTSYIFPKLEARYGDQFRQFMRDNLMHYTASKLHFLDRNDRPEGWEIIVVNGDSNLKSYLSESSLLFTF